MGGSIGIAIVFVGNLTAPSPDTDTNTTAATAATPLPMNHPLGITMGLCCAISIALYFTLQRHVSTVRPKSSQIVALSVVGPICIVVGFIGGASQVEEPMDVVWAFVQGGIVGPVAFGALAIAPKYLLASEVGLLQLLETIVGPVWVYLGGYEIPPLETVWGGLVLLATLAIYFAHELCGPGARGDEVEDGGREDGGRKDGGREDGGREDGDREELGNSAVHKKTSEDDVESKTELQAEEIIYI